MFSEAIIVQLNAVMYTNGEGGRTGLCNLRRIAYPLGIHSAREGLHTVRLLAIISCVKEVMFSPASVSLFVSSISQKKFGGKMAHRPGKKPLDLGGN